MTLEECYHRLGGDYADVLGRLGTRERVRRYLLLLPQDDSIPRLTIAWQGGNMSSAHQAAHTLRGLALTLGLTQLAAASAVLADALQDGHPADVPFSALLDTWQQTIDTIAYISD